MKRILAILFALTTVSISANDTSDKLVPLLGSSEQSDSSSNSSDSLNQKSFYFQHETKFNAALLTTAIVGNVIGDALVPEHAKWFGFLPALAGLASQSVKIYHERSARLQERKESDPAQKV